MYIGILKRVKKGMGELGYNKQTNKFPKYALYDICLFVFT